MRRALLFAAALVLFTCTSALADGGTVDYTGNVTLGGGPGFSFSFSEPGTLTSLDTFVTLDVTQGVTNFVFPDSEIQFFDIGEQGLFNLDFTSGSSNYIVELFGAQIYSPSGGSYNLLTGKFPVTGGFVFLNDDPSPISSVTGVEVTATAVAPEPAGLAMLGLGIAALLMLRKKQFGSAAV
jgi:hypothetical protein